MRLRLLILLLGLFISGLTVAQNAISDYNYIQVPEQFEFLKGKDQYQVNSLVRFLFKKHGFIAYMGDELPLNLRRQPCKGLYADVQGAQNFVYNKVTINIKDCYGNVLFVSDEGKSKDKDYRKAYHEAVRQAFESIAALNVMQEPLPQLTTDTETPDIEEMEGTVVANEQVSSANEAGGTVKVPEEAEMSAEVAAMVAVVSLTYKDYELLKDGTSYQVLYQGELIGSATPTTEKGVYKVVTSQFTGTGYEDEKNFRLERNIEGLDQTVTMLFKSKE